MNHMDIMCPPLCALTRDGVAHTHRSPLIVGGRVHKMACYIFAPVNVCNCPSRPAIAGLSQETS